MLIIYNLIRFFLYLVIMILALFNKKLLIFFKTRLFQKISNENFLEEDEKSILIHLSSVGEFNLSVELIEKILLRNEKIVISVMTDTGFSVINKKYGNNKNVKILYFPLDDFFALKKIYKTEKRYNHLMYLSINQLFQKHDGHQSKNLATSACIQ